MLRIAVLDDAHAIVHGDQLRNDEQWSSDQRDNRMEYIKKREETKGKRGGREEEKETKRITHGMLIVARDLIGAR